MQKSQSFSLLDERLSLLFCQGSPLLTKILGDLSIVSIRILVDDLSSLQLGPDHEGVHRSLHMILLVLPSLKLKDGYYQRF